jgi:polysaccharide biosynthesis protein PslH
LRILFIVPYVPNLIRVRPYNIIRHLHARGHQVTLATLWSSQGEREDLEKIRPYCEQILAQRLERWRSLGSCLAALFSTAPLQSAYCWHPALASELRASLVGGNGHGHTNNGHFPAFDVVHVEHLRGARFGLDLLAQAEAQDIPVVWDSVDSITFLFRQAARQTGNPIKRLLYQIETSRTAAFERKMTKRFHRVLVTSRVDQAAFESGPVGRPVVLPNGVDLDYFCPEASVQREDNTLVISGKMSYHANVRMVEQMAGEIMPEIWKERPDVRLWVVGKDPPEHLVALNEHSNITVTGTVPDLRPYLQRAAVAVSPLVYGAGVQNKVLEAMACATPVVASQRSTAALDGITAGRDLLIANSTADFARQVLDLLASPDRRKNIGTAGREYVERHHNWHRIAEDLEKIYTEAKND